MSMAAGGIPCVYLLVLCCSVSISSSSSSSGPSILVTELGSVNPEQVLVSPATIASASSSIAQRVVKTTAPDFFRSPPPSPIGRPHILKSPLSHLARLFQQPDNHWFLCITSCHYPQGADSPSNTAAPPDLQAKRAPAPYGFFGMRGKKRPSMMSFYGMRGKKADSTSFPTTKNDQLFKDEEEPLWMRIPAEGSKSNNDDGGQNEPGIEVGDDDEDEDTSGRALLLTTNGPTDYDDRKLKRAPSYGFLGLRGKRNDFSTILL